MSQRYSRDVSMLEQHIWASTRHQQMPIEYMSSIHGISCEHLLRVTSSRSYLPLAVCELYRCVCKCFTN